MQRARNTKRKGKRKEPCEEEEKEEAAMRRVEMLLCV